MVETGGWGGIAHYTWCLCKALGEQDTDVCLLTNNRYELNHLPRSFRTEQCFTDKVSYLQNVWRLLRRLSSLAPDIVHVQSLISTRFDAILWSLIRRRIPLVLTVHNVHSHEGTGKESRTLWRCFRIADAVVVHTQASIEEVSRRLGVDARIKLIHHGDYAFFETGVGINRVASCRLLNLPVDARLLLMFGAIRPYKGILGVIAVLPRIRDRYPNVHLVIAGPLLVGTEEEYREAILQAGVRNAVIFRPGYVPYAQVAAYFAAADIAVFNYRDVTDSGALRIACSLGIPVVATAVGGFREFLTDRVTGRLVPPNDPDSLADAVCEVLADPFEAAKMAKDASCMAVSQWSWTNSARATKELYSEILCHTRR